MAQKLQTITTTTKNFVEKVTLDYHRITKFHRIPKSNVNKTLQQIQRVSLSASPPLEPALSIDRFRMKQLDSATFQTIPADKKIQEKIETEMTKKKRQIGPVRKVQILFKSSTARFPKGSTEFKSWVLYQLQKKIASDWRLTRLYLCSCFKKVEKSQSMQC